MISLDNTHGVHFPIVRVETSLGLLEVCLYGAHVLNWTPRGGRPVFYMSGTAVYAEGKGLRGGVPICWPWFGKHPTNSKEMPKHGIARVSHWELTEKTESPAGEALLRFALHLPNLPETLYTLQMGKDTLHATLRTQAVPESMPFSAALHSYYAVSDFEHVQVEGLEDVSFQEFAEDVTEHSEAPLVPVGPINRIYYPVPPERVIYLRDEAWGRVLQLERGGSRSCVVWNPGEKEAASMSDIAPGTSRQFLAVETAAVPSEGIRLHAGDAHELSMRVKVLHTSA